MCYDNYRFLLSLYILLLLLFFLLKCCHLQLYANVAHIVFVPELFKLLFWSPPTKFFCFRCYFCCYVLSLCCCQESENRTPIPLSPNTKTVWEKRVNCVSPHTRFPKCRMPFYMLLENRHNKSLILWYYK